MRCSPFVSAPYAVIVLRHPPTHCTGAYDVMASKHLKGDVNYAWPGAEVHIHTAHTLGRDDLSVKHGNTSCRSP